jgi:putative PIN family toxin of toxin-antitoxin system
MNTRLAAAPAQPLRIVVDSNVLLRYLIRPSAAIKTLIEVWWLGGHVQMVTGPALRAELAEVLARSKIGRFVQPHDGQALLDAIDLLAEVIALPEPIPAFSRDSKDDKFIACALAGAASFLVTTDEDLLVLHTVDTVQIITPQRLAALLQAMAS